MRVRVGPVDWIATDSCVAVGDGRAVVVRVGDRVHAFRNQCIHQDAELHGGIVRAGVLSCPFHFWRYHVETGQLIGSQRRLARYPVDVVEGVAWVLIPDEAPPMPLRDSLLARARQYDRQAAFSRDHPVEVRAATTSASDTSPKSS
jgi:nitrite reductase/ring-hydroxylating ferredoxin subunit